jgi:hypothetical protein
MRLNNALTSTIELLTRELTIAESVSLPDAISPRKQSLPGLRLYWGKKMKIDKLGFCLLHISECGRPVHVGCAMPRGTRLCSSDLAGVKVRFYLYNK